ncbi:hypothetical protein KZZ52_42810 [Dactylosporangium sp. AC04546]|uniref:hypothetical protein n=1 Tax=Dactylosporangium sp. AC04546 TaxID=2862460 RepID=UPI001EE0DB24|nr:hypothetical protein [Dactylosporangium sp. AC04546]WVK80645.1 hypothetical protein KZZ52_42810 [Dactylosporangium sp. AC04546]
MRMLQARSPEECQLYMALHPCACGESTFAWSRHYTVPEPGRPDERGASVYEGDCPGCRRSRRFRFLIPLAPAPSPAFGGAEPSRIIDPAQFLDHYRATVATVVPDPARVPAHLLPRQYALLRTGLAALEEVLKFVPPGATVVPAGSFTSAAGAASYARDPGQFRRERLIALLELHQVTVAAYARALTR